MLHPDDGDPFPPRLLDETADVRDDGAALVSILNDADLQVSCSAAPAGAWSVDPTPPQLTADYIFSPSILIQHDSYNLVYEMRLTNYAPRASTLESIDAIAGPKTFSYSGIALRNLLKPVGQQGFVGTNTIVEPGQTLVLTYV